jgi:hypothetical protein
MTTIINGSSPSITFSDSTTQTTAGLTGSTSQLAKAWVNFSGSTINGSFNVSSVTVAGTGLYAIAFTTSMANANYSVAGMPSRISGDAYFNVVYLNASTPSTASTCNLQAKNSLGGYENPYPICISVFSA